MPNDFKPSDSLSRFGVRPGDPGYVYILRSGPKLKIGCSKDREKRIRQAKTWLPDCEIVAVKPFWGHRDVEKYIHIGLSQFWYKQEWYEFEGDEFEEWFISEFQLFSDTDINSNSIDFIYFMNSTGMSEMTLEMSRENISKSKFLRKLTGHSSK